MLPSLFKKYVDSQTQKYSHCSTVCALKGVIQASSEELNGHTVFMCIIGEIQICKLSWAGAKFLTDICTAYHRVGPQSLVGFINSTMIKIIKENLLEKITSPQGVAFLCIYI